MGAIYFKQGSPSSTGQSESKSQDKEAEALSTTGSLVRPLFTMTQSAGAVIANP
jgi:hypothetical protein